MYITLRKRRLDRCEEQKIQKVNAYCQSCKAINKQYNMDHDITVCTHCGELHIKGHLLETYVNMEEAENDRSR